MATTDRRAGKTNHSDCTSSTIVADYKQRSAQLRLPTGKEDISMFCSIEKASEAHEHLVQQTAAVLVSQLSLTELLQSAHLLVHHPRRLL